MQVDQEYELVEVGRLREHPQNPRRGDEDAIRESVEKNGWYGVVTAQRSTGFILAGNHRYRVAVQEGAEVVPTVWKDIDDQTAIRILLADNATADLGTYDEETLQALLSGLESLEGTGWGRTLEAAAEAAEKAAEAPEEAPAPDKYTPQFAIFVECEDEEDQRIKYEELVERMPDWSVRVVAV